MSGQVPCPNSPDGEHALERVPGGAMLCMYCASKGEIPWPMIWVSQTPGVARGLGLAHTNREEAETVHRVAERYYPHHMVEKLIEAVSEAVDGASEDAEAAVLQFLEEASNGP